MIFMPTQRIEKLSQALGIGLAMIETTEILDGYDDAFTLYLSDCANTHALAAVTGIDADAYMRQLDGFEGLRQTIVWRYGDINDNTVIEQFFEWRDLNEPLGVTVADVLVLSPPDYLRSLAVTCLCDAEGWNDMNTGDFPA